MNLTPEQLTALRHALSDLWAIADGPSFTDDQLCNLGVGAAHTVTELEEAFPELNGGDVSESESVDLTRRFDYCLGFVDGHRSGEDNNPFDKDSQPDEHRTYRLGFYNGVTEYINS